MNILPHTPPEIIGQFGSADFDSLNKAVQQGSLRGGFYNIQTGKGENEREALLLEALSPLIEMIISRESKIKLGINFRVESSEVPQGKQQRPGLPHTDRDPFDKRPIYTVADRMPTEFYARRHLLFHHKNGGDDFVETRRQYGFLDILQHKPETVVRFKRQRHVSPHNLSSEPVFRTWIRAVVF